MRVRVRVRVGVRVKARVRVRVRVRVAYPDPNPNHGTEPRVLGEGLHHVAERGERRVDRARLVRDVVRLGWG